jgi:hypothetical protein
VRVLHERPWLPSSLPAACQPGSGRRLCGGGGSSWSSTTSPHRTCFYPWPVVPSAPLHLPAWSPGSVLLQGAGRAAQGAGTWGLGRGSRSRLCTSHLGLALLPPRSLERVGGVGLGRRSPQPISSCLDVGCVCCGGGCWGMASVWMLERRGSQLLSWLQFQGRRTWEPYRKTGCRQGSPLHPPREGRGVGGTCGSCSGSFTSPACPQFAFLTLLPVTSPPSPVPRVHLPIADSTSRAWGEGEALGAPGC